MKKSFILLSSALLTASILAGCNKNKEPVEIAVVTDVGQLMDGGFNQGTYEGAKKYAEAHKIAYNYYAPANGSKATDADREAAMNSAIENGAKVIVAPGFLQEKAMRNVAQANPDVKFVFVDGWNLGRKNITAISYKEEEAGYMAGYAVTKEGYTKLGGTFGGGGSNPACNRFSYGFIQGANAAATAMGKTVEYKMSFKNGSSFSASTELQTQISGWYKAGTEVVFSCGGSMVNSVIAAAQSYENAKIVGVDTDQAALSPKIITSATKGLAVSVEKVLGEFYDGKWDAQLADKTSKLGAADNATGLPTADGSWRFKTFTKEEYKTLFDGIAKGSITIDSKTPENMNTQEVWTAIDEKLTAATISFEA